MEGASDGGPSDGSPRDGSPSAMGVRARWGSERDGGASDGAQTMGGRVTVHVGEKGALMEGVTADTCSITRKQSLTASTKGTRLTSMKSTPLRERWKVKSMELDGWLGNQFYANPEQRTITITMDVRLCKYMKEWLPVEMELEPPPTPYHPETIIFNMEDTVLSSDEGKKAHRLCAQLLYYVTTVYLNAQWCIYYIARYTSHPTKLYKEALLHAHCDTCLPTGTSD